MNNNDKSIEHLKQYKQQILSKVDDKHKVLIEGYIDNLHKKKVPIIFDRLHLYSYISQINLNEIEFFEISENNTNFFYRPIYINKKNKEKREILAPSYKLKVIQKWILVNILSQLEIHPSCHGFVVNKSIKTNAAVHLNQTIILSIDIKNFFDSITYKDVNDIFSRIEYFDEVTDILSELCTYKDKLPQGAPTSPYLSNLFLYDFDTEVFNFCSEKNLNYSRYADDITISGNDMNIEYMLTFLTKKLKKYHMEINENKTRYAYNWQRQSVTGVLVNDRLNISKKYRNDLRQEIYYLNKFGVDSHLQKKYELSDKFVVTNYKNHIYGKVYFLKIFDDLLASKYLQILNDIEWS